MTILGILNWILLAFMCICNAAWIRLILMRNKPICKFCRNCLYDGRCPMQGERRKTP